MVVSVLAFRWSRQHTEDENIAEGWSVFFPGTAYSRSIVKNAEKSFIFNAILVGSCTDTMENTMFKNSCHLPGKTAD